MKNRFRGTVRERKFLSWRDDMNIIDDWIVREAALVSSLAHFSSACLTILLWSCDHVYKN